MSIWALPENIEDVLPTDAAKLERMRRTALDLFAVHGYALVVPPLLEYVDSLLSGLGRDLDLATFKLVDQLSGKMMGLRADTTPQVARIDAHVLNRQGVSRLCYAGSVLHTRPSGLGKSREPFQVGAELYGHSGLGADLEIQQLMIDTLAAVGVTVVKLGIGHPAIFRALVRIGDVRDDAAEALFHAVVSKDIPALRVLGLDYPVIAAALVALPTLYGGMEVLAKARRVLPADRQISAALDELEIVAEHFGAQQIPLSVDLGELGGFNYESGIVFAAFAGNAADAVARGGRYDEVGKAFGRARAATGFSMDLKSLLALTADATPDSAILAPVGLDAAGATMVRSLRAEGQVVIQALPGNPIHHGELGCDRELIKKDGAWSVRTLDLPTNSSLKK